MGKIIKLTEGQLKRIIKNILNEQYITDKTQLQANTWYKLINDENKVEYRIKLKEVDPNKSYMIGDCYNSNNKLIQGGRETYFDNGKMKIVVDSVKGDVSNSVYIIGPVQPFNQTSNQNTTTTSSVTPNPKNLSLKTVNDVKKFQDWLDTYKPNWYRNGKLSRGKGWGTLGPYTKKAWEMYKNDYK